MSQRPIRSPATGFAGLGLDPRLLAGLTALGYEEPTPIQTAAIPPLLAGKDVLARAATGTGKTAAFALPLLHRLTPEAAPRERTTALVLVPTRELAMQVAEAVHRYGKVLGVRVLPVYGGASMGNQVRALKRGVDVVIGTPGRLLDHIRRETVSFASLRVVVLDEADEMLDMGFAEDLEAILAATPATKQTALFSATIPPRIATIARKHLRQPVTIETDQAMLRAGAIATVRQVAYVVARPQKLAALARVLDIEHPVSAIVFCRTRTEVDELTETLTARGHRAEALHGGLSQDQRDRVMQRFRGRKSDLLVATDVAARGLDVQHVSHVINYDVPVAADAYVHRIGRTGRAGRAGMAITFAEPREHRMLRNIERVTSKRIEIAPIPTVADLRARRQEVARAKLRETIVAGELDAWRGIVASLAEEFDVMDVAAAAVKQADTRPAGDDERDIPAPAVYRDARPGPHPARRPAPGPGRGRPAPARSVDMVRLFVPAGRALRITPGDLVGAIANEVGISGRVIGAIHIDERHATVEVPREVADQVVAALRATTIKGKRLNVRRDRGSSA
jgi:ATP-dependent RNA helicase DeaD